MSIDYATRASTDNKIVIGAFLIAIGITLAVCAVRNELRRLARDNEGEHDEGEHDEGEHDEGERRLRALERKTAAIVPPVASCPCRFEPDPIPERTQHHPACQHAPAPVAAAAT